MKKNIPLDELEVKLGLLNLIVDLDSLTSSEICKALSANFDVECSEQDVFLLKKDPKELININYEITTYKDTI